MQGWAAVRQAANEAMVIARQELAVDRTQPCPQLLLAVDAFLDDPITEYYGVGGEMVELVEWHHVKKHNCQGYGDES